MNKLYITLGLSCCCFLNLNAQELFVKQAKITYEKKIRPANELEGASSPVFAQMNESFIKGGVSSWSMVFNDRYSTYKSIPIVDDASIYREMMNRNLKDEIYFDYENNARVKKKMYNKEARLLEDSIPVLEWKLLSEVREIAGYECRKALTRINDTVYVVAFYTDRILLKGGPEGFNGLPGMILGLAIPRLRTTWFATKVELSPIDPKELQPPVGKKTTIAVMAAEIEKASSGPYGSTQTLKGIINDLQGFLL